MNTDLRPTSCAYSIEEAFQSDSNRTDFHYYLLSSAHIFIGFSCWKAFAEEDPKKINFFSNSKLSIKIKMATILGEADPGEKKNDTVR